MNQLEKLKAEQSKIEQQIAQEQHKLQRLRNRKQYYEKGERTKRITPTKTFATRKSRLSVLGRTKQRTGFKLAICSKKRKRTACPWKNCLRINTL